MKRLLQNKFLLTALSISTAVLVLVLIFLQKNVNPADPTQSNDSQAAQDRPELIDLNQEKRREAMIYVESIETKLPLYLGEFKTSVGITTSINLYRLGDDEAEVVRLEIYGLSYLNQDTNEKTNPNVTAFKESYLKAMEMLEGQNIDPKKLIFIYGDKGYVRTTSQAWVSALKLHP